MYYYNRFISFWRKKIANLLTETIVPFSYVYYSITLYDIAYYS